MKKTWKTLLAASMILPVAACSSSSAKEDAETIDAKEAYGCNVINVYNWGEYISPDTIPAFEKKYNATVKYDLFESNETMYTKLLGGNSYDILVPSDYMIERLMMDDMLQPLEEETLAYNDTKVPQVLEMQKVYDPELKYSVAYFWGSVGIVYDTTKVDPAEIEEKGWDILKDTKYKGDIFMYDSQRDSFMVAMKALGYSMNTESDAEIQKSYEWLKELNDTMAPAYVTDEVIDEMVNGSKAMAVMYSGDAAYVMSENENMAFIEPNQGTNLWSDAMVIPANSTCPGLANEFIRFVSEEEQAYDISDAVGYSSTNEAVLEELGSDGGTYDGISAYLPREGYAKDESFRYNEILKQKLSDLWNKVKIGG